MTDPRPKKATAPKRQLPTHQRFCLPLAELAGMIDVRPETLRGYLARGCPEPPATGEKRAASAWAKKARAWVESDKDRRADERRPTNQHDVDPQAAAHQREFQKWRAAEVRLRVARETRQVVSRKEVAEFVVRAFLAFKQRLLTLVPKMTVRLEDVPGHVVHEELTVEIDDILNGLAGGLKHVADLVAIDGECPFCNAARGGTADT